MSNRFLVFHFALRKDNQGNRRLFRYIRGFRKEAEGRAWLREKELSGKSLYGVLFRRDSFDVVVEFGDDEVEQHWLDSQTSQDSVGTFELF